MRGAVLFALLAIAPGPAPAETALQIDAPPCAGRIHVRAQDVPLGDVLKGLSRAMGFRLDVKVDLAERVSLDRRDTPERLLKQLLQGRNLVMQADPARQCQGRETLTTVWVLPAGQDQPARAATTDSGSVGGPPVHPRPRGTRRNMTEEQWQQMKQDYKAGKVKADPKTGQPVPADAEAGEAPAQEPR